VRRSERKWIPVFVLAGTAGALSVGLRPSSHPNLVVIVIDSLRADAISRSTGAPHTPACDGLAREGQAFPAAFAHAPLTLPAHAALLSGRPPDESGVRVGGQAIERALPLLAEHLARRGYQTGAAIGSATPWPPGSGPGIARGFQVCAQGPGESTSGDEVTRDAARILDGFDPDEPFFLFAHYAQPPERHDARDDAGRAGRGLLDDRPSAAGMRARYRLQVEAADRAVGALLDELRRRDLYENALIVLTGDHGEALGEHGHFGQAVSLYDEMLSVPLVVRLPLGRRTAELEEAACGLVRHIDVAPTILELLDVQALPGASGTSLLHPARRELVAETHPPEAPRDLFALRDERYKLIFDPSTEAFEMYRLGPDPLELDDVFAHQGHLRDDWQRRLRDLARRAGAVPAAPLEGQTTARRRVPGQ